MIVTVTPNPSLDRTAELPGPIVRGQVHRFIGSTTVAAGKGVNISGVVHSAGAETLAIVPAGAMDGLVVPEGMRVHPARDLVDAVSAVQPVPLPGLPANPQRGERPPFRATA